MPCRFMAGWTRWNGRGAQRAKTRRAGFMRTWTLKLSAVFPLSAAPAFRMRGREDFHRLKVPGQICQGDSLRLLHRLSGCQEQGTGCLKAPVQIVVCFPFVCCTGFPDAGAGGFLPVKGSWSNLSGGFPLSAAPAFQMPGAGDWMPEGSGSNCRLFSLCLLHRLSGCGGGRIFTG